MAKIPAFFQSTFPVETYGAMYDPGAMSAAAQAQSRLASSQIQNLSGLMGSFFNVKEAKAAAPMLITEGQPTAFGIRMV